MKKSTILMLSLIGGATMGIVATKKAIGATVNVQKNLSDKHLALFKMMNQWVAVKQDGKNLSDYFEKMQYKTIAIYGMHYAGERLLKELKNSNIQVKYGIDKRADWIYTDIDVVTMEDEFDEVDAVVVTPIFFFREIEKELSEKIGCPIISLEDVLKEV